MTNNLMYLNQIATYLKVSPGKLNIESNSIPVRAQDNVIVKGFLNIIKELLKVSKTKLPNNSIEDNAEIYQWIEYGLLYIAQSNCIHPTLKEFNNVLATRTYLVSHRLTIADIVLYYIVYNIMDNLSYLDKENFIHISRWFDNMQQDAVIRQKNKLIDFNSSCKTLNNNCF